MIYLDYAASSPPFPEAIARSSSAAARTPAMTSRFFLSMGLLLGVVGSFCAQGHKDTR